MFVPVGTEEKLGFDAATHYPCDGYWVSSNQSSSAAMSWQVQTWLATPAAMAGFSGKSRPSDGL